MLNSECWEKKHIRPQTVHMYVSDIRRLLMYGAESTEAE